MKSVFGEIFLQFMFWGMLLGVLAGFLFNLVILGHIFAGIFGALLGGFAGLILGIGNGLAVATLTVCCFYPLSNSVKYRFVSTLTTSIITFTGCMFILQSVLVSSWENSLAEELSFLASICAVVLAILATYNVSFWYISFGQKT